MNAETGRKTGRSGPRLFLRIVLAVFAITLLAAAIAVPLYVSKYKPITDGGYGRRPATGIETEVTARASTGENIPVVRVPYVDGEADYYGFSIRNTGPLSVKILSVGADTSRGLWKQVAVVMRLAFQRRPPFREFAPFQPFMLKTGEEMWFEVTSRFANCEFWGPGGSNGFESVEVRYQVAWQKKTVEIPLSTQIEVMSPEKCPRQRQE